MTQALYVISLLNGVAMFCIFNSETLKNKLNFEEISKCASSETASIKPLNLVDLCFTSLKVLSNLGFIKTGCYILPLAATSAACFKLFPGVLSWFTLPSKINKYFSSEKKLLEMVKSNEKVTAELIEKLATNYGQMSANIDSQNLVLDKLVSAVEVLEKSTHEILLEVERQKNFNNSLSRNITAISHNLELITQRIDNLL